MELIKYSRSQMKTSKDSALLLIFLKDFLKLSTSNEPLKKKKKFWTLISNPEFY